MKARRFAASTLVLAVIFSVIAGGMIFTGEASAANLTNFDEVEIDCAQYMAGTESIDVYSNASVKNYELRINGGLLDSITNPAQYATRQWNNSFWQVRAGTQSGTDNGLVVNTNNSDYIRIQSTNSGVRTSANTFWFYNATAPDISYIKNATVYFSVMVEGAGTVGNLRFQRWNGVASTWVNEINIAGATRGTLYNRKLFYTGANLTTMFSQRDAMTLNVGFGVEAAVGGGGGSNHFLRTYYMVIVFKTEKPISITPTFKLIDTYSLDTTLYADGVYNISAKVTDFANKVFRDYKIVTVDNTLPAIPSITVNPLSPNNTYPATITSSVSDANLEYSEGRYVNQFGYYITIPNYLSTTFTFKDFFTNGTYNFYFYARDKAGNYKSLLKTFTVSYAKVIVYVYNPIVEITVEAEKSDLNDPVGYGLTVDHVGKFEIFINGTLSQSVNDPSGTYSYSINSLTKANFNIKFDIYYENDTFFRTSTFNVAFDETDVFVYLPIVEITIESEKSDLNDPVGYSLTVDHVGKFEIFINGTLDQSVDDPSGTYTYSINSLVKANFNIKFDIYYENDTFFRSSTFNVAFAETDVFVYLPIVEITVEAEKSDLNDPVGYGLTVDHVGKFEIFINGTLSQSVDDPVGTYSYSINSLVKANFNIKFDIYYENDTFFRTSTFNVAFAETDVFVYLPVVAVSYPSIMTTGETAEVTLTCANCGNIEAYLNGTLEETFVNPTSDTLYITTSVEETFDVRLDIYYPNGTFYEDISFLIPFYDPDVTFVYRPTFIYGYSNNTYQEITIDVQAENVQKVDVYVNGTLETTFLGSSVDDSLTLYSTVLTEYVVKLSIYYTNGTLFQDVIKNLVIQEYSEPDFIFKVEARRIKYSGELIDNSEYKMYINGTRVTSRTFSFVPFDDIHVLIESDFGDEMYDNIVETTDENQTLVVTLNMYWLTLNNNRDDDVQVRISRNDIVLPVTLGPFSSQRVLLYDVVYSIEWVLDYDATPGAVAPITDGGDIDMEKDRSIDFFPSGTAGITPEIVVWIIVAIGATAGVFTVLGIQEFIVKKPAPSTRGGGTRTPSQPRKQSSGSKTKAPVSKKGNPVMRPQRKYTQRYTRR